MLKAGGKCRHLQGGLDLRRRGEALETQDIDEGQRGSDDFFKQPCTGLLAVSEDEMVRAVKPGTQPVVLNPHRSRSS